jgi:formylglycine-generating enzyme required for sulfatase activity
MNLSTTSGDLARTPVTFSAQTDYPDTRTSAGGEQWLTTDEVGIYMVTTGQTLSTASISEGADNRKYLPQTAAAASALIPATTDQTIYFPQSGAVNFVAYYPWKSSGSAAGQINNYVYPIDLADQSDPAALDLLYARKANISKNQATVNLTFAHPLSKITLRVKKGADISAVDFSSATATISGMPVTASFSLADGTIGSLGAVTNFNALKVTTAATFDAGYEALLLPQAVSDYTGRQVTFTAGGNTYEWEIPDASAFEAGKNYIYTLLVRSTGVDVEEASTTPIGSITPWVNDDHSVTGVIETVRIPAGTFLMGSPTTEPERTEVEIQHEVTLTQDFYMSKYEITNEQYLIFLNALGIEGVYDYRYGIEPMHDYGYSGQYNGHILIWGRTSGIYWDTEHTRWGVRDASYQKHPVANVTWYGADEYARWVGGSLPTEEQWEYACRAGTTTPFGVGDGNSLYADQANFDGRSPYSLPGGTISNYSGYDGSPNTFLNHPTPVGSYSPNAWGLYDMHGNVAEWCSDYGCFWEGAELVMDMDSRAVRGGGYNYRASYCRSAYRSRAPFNSYHDSHMPNLGFRVVFPVE